MIGGADNPPKATVNIWRFEIVREVACGNDDRPSPFGSIRFADVKHNEKLTRRAREVHRRRNLTAVDEMNIAG